MSAETLTPPEIPASVVRMDESMNAFDRATEGMHETAPADRKPEPVIETPKEEKKTEATNGELKIPEHLLTGEDPKAPKQDEPEDLDKLFSEEPKGQLKHEHYKKVQQGAKTAVEKARAELTALREEYETHKKSNGKVPESFQKEYEATKAELAKYREAIQRSDLQNDPAFVGKYQPREDAKRRQLTTAAKELGLDAELVETALHSSYKRRLEIVRDLTSSLDTAEGAQGDLMGLMRAYDDIQEEKRSELEKAGETAAAYHKERQAQREAEEARIRKEEDNVFSEALEDAKKKLFPFQRVEGNEAWNKQADSLIEEAKRRFNEGSNLREVADTYLQGVAYKVQATVLQQAQKDLKEARAQIAKLTGASPSGGNGPGYKAEDKTLSKEEQVMRAFDRAIEGAANQQNGGFGGHGQI